MLQQVLIPSRLYKPTFFVSFFKKTIDKYLTMPYNLYWVSFQLFGKSMVIFLENSI